jgi:hypothetical protein
MVSYNREKKEINREPYTREPGTVGSRWIRRIALTLALLMARPALGQDWTTPLALPPCAETASVSADLHSVEAKCERAIDVWRYLYLDTDDRLAREQRARALAESQLQTLRDAQDAEPVSVPLLWTVVISSAAFLLGGVTVVLLTK